MQSKSTSLVFPKNYFDRWREFSQTRSGAEAWEAVEAELFRENGVRRYTSYNSFLHGKMNERSLSKAKRIVLFAPDPELV